MTAYKWKFSMNVPAQQAGEFLTELENEKGSLTPQIVLEASRDEKSVLHPCFEWDDEKAAEGYRLYQAGKILRNITVVIEKENTPPQNIRAFVNVSDSSKHETGKFISLNVAMKNDDYRKQILRNALYELQTFKNKYSNYAELEKLFVAIDELENDLTI